MNTRPARVPNVETAERRASRLQREATIADQLAFLESFDRQVTALAARDDKPQRTEPN